MRKPLTLLLLSGLLLFAGAACSSGSKEETGDLTIKCLNGEGFCLVSCDLGCSQVGCAVTEIAENQRLRFVFSDRIDPGSVNSASLSIRTASGVQPDGDYLVQGRELTFVPRVSVVNGVSTFGFLRNESYIITLNTGASGQGVRSIAGDGLTRSLSCTVLVSRGIQDEDLLPPTVELVAPTDLTAVPRQPTVVLRFSELIDTTALQGTLTASSPVQFILKGSKIEGGVRVCDSLQAGTVLSGIPILSTEFVAGRPVTVLAFTPSSQLPGNYCLAVVVSADVRDLSGRQGPPAQFEMLTEAGASQAITITETFANSGNQELAASTTEWSSGARPGLIGNDGRHGSFDVTLGNPLGAGVYEWNTDSFTIAADRSLTGDQYLITDGKFYFSDFNLPAGTTLRFTGTVPPQIWVRGSASIAGTIDIRGGDLPFYVPPVGPAANQRVLNYNGVGPTNQLNQYPTPDGQPGSAGGIGGGRGGDGARECRGDGDVTQTIGLEVVHIYYGRNGENLKLQAGHAYAGNTANTGGKGAVLRPAAGTFAAASTPLIGIIYRGHFSPGGGGGGFTIPGTTAAITTQPSAATVGPIQAGGVALPALLPVPGTSTSLNHFLIGGSGGGGGGSHAYGSLNNAAIGYYTAGAAGTGGGGALALRVGGDLTVAATAVLTARGGDGALITGDDPISATTADVNWGALSPGGGGSGGSLLLQAGGSLTYDGSIDVRGGKGSTTGSMSVVALSAGTPAAFNIVSRGGDGSPGFYRLESGEGVPSFTGTAASGTPAYVAGTNGDVLIDRDELSGSMSKWRSSGQVFPPTWLRYELDVDLDGDGDVDETYTDSGAAGTQKADDPNGPVQIRFQGAVLDQSGVPTDLGDWYDGVGSGSGPGIYQDSVTAFRFQLLFNRAANPNTVVRALRVFAQT
ncbi:MAG: hypothetical protein JNL08_20325 [Planctomycetes bacterium]|nr:hypothetical protein [Planctomycetota bacterium]